MPCGGCTLHNMLYRILQYTHAMRVNCIYISNIIIQYKYCANSSIGNRCNISMNETFCAIMCIQYLLFVYTNIREDGSV
jgi:hypothetical protein